MSTRVLGSLLLLVALVFSLNVGEFAAQDPPQPMPTPPAPQFDLSGTYTGTFNCEPAGLMGETTLTITGNQFTTSDGKSGRFIASPSGAYTAVAFQVGEFTPAATPGAAGPTTMPQIISLRARKQGNRLILTAAPGTNVKCSFTPTRSTARGRRNQSTPPATGTEVANPATSPVPATSPTTTPEPPVPAQTPSPSPSPTASPTPQPSPTPEPNPTPEPSPEPNPSPAPSPDPTPNPSPMPSPTATPSPRA